MSETSIDRLSPKCSKTAVTGQGALIVISVTMLIALVLAGTSLSGLSWQTSKRTVAVQQSLQTYYVAQAGVQEALATRMVPRSNALNFMTTASGLPAWKIKPYHQYSGLVYQNPVNRTGLIGVYRYLVVGGDPSRKADGSYYGNTDMTDNPNSPKPRLVSFQTSPKDSYFYVISNGITCKTAGGKIGTNQLTGSPTTNPANIGLNPSCKTGYVKDEVTVVSRINMESEIPSVDRLNRTMLFKNRAAIKLPGRAFIPGTGGGWTDTVNFDNAWNHTSATNTPAKPTRIVFFDFATYGIYKNVALSGTSVNAGSVPARSSIMLYFDGPIDYRSISSNITGGAPASLIYNANLDGCKLGKAGSLNNCAIQLRQGSTITSGMLIVPILPYLTKVMLLAPLGGGMSAGTTYQLLIRQDYISSFSGSTNNAPYTVTFTAN